MSEATQTRPTPFVSLTGIARHSPSPKRRKRLELPAAGHHVARLWWFVGAASYGVLFVAFVGTLLLSGKTQFASLLGLGDQKNPAIFVLVGAGLVLTISAMYRAWLDISRMADEEADVDWVDRHGKEGLPLVFVDRDKRESMLGQHVEIPDNEISVETLMDDRVRRVRMAAIDPNAGAVVPGELKGVAEVRTSEMGSFPRYASSLLLLLAVLGTFAGVKTALPGLIDSITTSTGGADAAAANAGLVKSLGAVAEAFGGNALALIGAIAVGIMAQGIGFGRRNLLERLELVSAEFLYGQNVTADANPMQAAMVALRDTAREMHSASGAMVGIEGQLNLLGREFRTAFDSLANKMQDIAIGQEEALYSKTSESLETLQQRVNELADTVEANARTYAGLAEAVKTRSQEASRAFDAMAESNKQMGMALESIVATGQRSKVSMERLSDAVDELTKNSAQVAVEVQGVTLATRSIAPAMVQLEKTLGHADQRLAASEQAAQEGWKNVAEQVAKRLDRAVPQRVERVEVSAAPPVAGRSGFDDDAVRLLQSIATSIDRLNAPRPTPMWKTATATFVGVSASVGSAIGVWYLWARLSS
jgi:uncharacterized protein YoxC